MKTETLEFEIGTGDLSILYSYKDKEGVDHFQLFKKCRLIKK